MKKFGYFLKYGEHFIGANKDICAEAADSSEII